MKRNHPDDLTREPLVYRLSAFVCKPANLLLVFFLCVLVVLSLFPMVTMLSNMFTIHLGTEKKITRLPTGSWTLIHFQNLFKGNEWSRVNFWDPLRNSFIVAFGAGLLGIAIGGTVAWFVTRSDLKCKKFISSVFVFPYMMPAWTLALFWTNMFQNSRVGGGNIGMVESIFGICMPEWFVYGLFPMVVVIGLHYSPFAYLLIGGILKNMDATLEESATILKANRATIIRRVTIPIVMPAILSTFLLIFSSGFSSYTVPVFLGSPVRYYVLSTKMKSLMDTYSGQAYIIAAVMIIFGVAILMLNQRVTNSRKQFTTVTGKSSQISLINLRRANRPIAIILVVLLLLVAVLPLLTFAMESVIIKAGDYSLSNMTLDFWIGRNLDYLDQGDSTGILFSAKVWKALGYSLLLAVTCSVVAGTSGILVGYGVAKRRGSRLASWVNSLSFFPYLMPSLAFGAIYLSMSSHVAWLRGFALLALVGSVKYLPFASRSGVNAMLQLSGEIEEAALITGVPWWKRMVRVIFPIQKSSFLSGYLLPMVSCMRELSLFVLLVPTSNTILTTMLMQYSEKGWAQFGNAINLLIIVVVLLVNLTVNKLTGASIDKGVGG